MHLPTVHAPRQHQARQEDRARPPNLSIFKAQMRCHPFYEAFPDACVP